jgi:hypothetical protein
MAGNGGFHVATHVGNSNIDGAGRGRFSDETIKAGSIIRTQSFGGEFLAVYENLEELVPNISNQEQTSLVDTRVVESPVYTTPTHLAHFGCSIPNDQPDARYTTVSPQLAVLYVFVTQWLIQWLIAVLLLVDHG